MVSTDPIADMLTRIRNAIAVQKNEVSLPHSNIKQTVAEVLAKSGFLSKVETKGENGFKTLVITINEKDTNAKITEIKRLSTPGRRMYAPAKAIPTVKYGRGMVVISTSKGIMNGSQAKQAGLGGELICKVY
ncbi:30S ribosomal protein S8 [Candidatus Saccharibacteria bacterium]|jgi:small subunit ribosomal protein S8|nr:30S ribosomal protein S8 [Candidatus Saccharibacteria bacterium]MBP7834473.1 30S ribosomal protein S8 [Candidatus Saccharibacteria bacterium]